MKKYIYFFKSEKMNECRNKNKKYIYFFKSKKKLQVQLMSFYYIIETIVQ